VGTNNGETLMEK